MAVLPFVFLTVFIIYARVKFGALDYLKIRCQLDYCYEPMQYSWIKFPDQSLFSMKAHVRLESSFRR